MTVKVMPMAGVTVRDDTAVAAWVAPEASDPSLIATA